MGRHPFAILAGIAGLLCLLTVIGHGGNRKQITKLRLLRAKDEGAYDGDASGQCSRGNPAGLKDRPLLLFKYARTGSTWLAWTGNTLRLQSGRPMMWTHEAQGCNKESAEGLAGWMTEYFSRVTDGTYISKHHHPKGQDKKCRTTAGKNADELGVLVATLNPHETHPETPELTHEQWTDLFRAVPDLAVGVLYRTNAVKRALSVVTSDAQKALCGSKKLTGKEACIKDLPDQIHVNTTHLLKGIRDSENKRRTETETAARISRTYGDGRVFCLSYEAMQQDLAGEMEALGDYLGSPIDQASLDELSVSSVSYKRGSDDLSEYIENYEEVRTSLSSNRCLMDQLVSQEPQNFPICSLDSDDQDEETLG